MVGDSVTDKVLVELSREDLNALYNVVVGHMRRHPESGRPANKYGLFKLKHKLKAALAAPEGRGSRVYAFAEDLLVEDGQPAYPDATPGKNVIALDNPVPSPTECAGSDRADQDWCPTCGVGRWWEGSNASGMLRSVASGLTTLLPDLWL